ncbi:HAAS signaling domain-containing protein [Microbacterium sp. JZ31]|uniref:HAAS signaling domain-containing protein n=1 Tax=Microbacterium sp. JZ31 TaxID=1906274 RepID=UPI0019332083|nr:hypothetical protein [Microbacterium sp. JZ31]
MSELLDRYVDAATRSVPPTSRDDIAAELRASIADQLEPRLEAGEPGDAAERSVLTELGDPAILAARYADRPLHLIGPAYYLDWLRLLKLLLWIVLPCVAFAWVLGQAIAGASVGTMLGGGIGVLISVAVHLAFWTTFAFWIAERAQTPGPVREWTPDELPLATEARASRAEVILALAFVVIAAALVLWDRFIDYVPWDVAEGRVLPLLNPALWPWTLVVIPGAAAISAFILLGVHLARRWTYPAAIANAVLALAVGGIGLWLHASGLLWNADAVSLFVQHAGEEPVRIVGIIIGVCLVGFPLWSIADGFLKARRGRPVHR